MAWTALLPALAPLAYLAAAALARRDPGLRPRRALAAARAATLVALAAALAAALGVALHGPATARAPGALAEVLSLRVDALSVTLFALVAFVGAVVVRFSRNYLDGDANQGRFVGDLCLTLAAVTLLVTAGGLWLLVAAWIATSLALHRLLVFYPERRRAVVAARKKFVIARIGDLCLIAAAVLLVGAFGTADLETLLAAARAAEPGTAGTGVAAAALLIALAAMLKSAQFPAHGWLTEVMETPTPVSALLHAGIINAGGFLVVRFADVMLLHLPALHLLALVGGFTALFGGLAMLTQTSVKVQLAWSTVAQMGFMLLQCGLGAFPVAVLHIVAHSLYKAHAFLSSGSIVESLRATRAAGAPARPRIGHLLAAFAGALAIYLGVSWAAVSWAAAALLGGADGQTPGAVALGAVLVMALTVLLTRGVAGRTDARVVARVVGAAAGVAVVYVGLQAAAAGVLGDSVPAAPAPDGVGLAVIALAVASFALVTLLQLAGPPRWAATWALHAHVHLANGFYANALFDRWVGAFRPPPGRRQAAPASPVDATVAPNTAAS